MMKSKEEFLNEVSAILHNNILNYWIKNAIDDEFGGFVGRINGADQIVKGTVKGAILNARLLWAFSAAYRVSAKSEYLQIAERAKQYLLTHFYDDKYGGIYWSVNEDGTPYDTKKQIYAIGFAIYGLSEYVRATKDLDALEFAIKLYRDVEKYAFDSVYNGYTEAFTREWLVIDDMRLSQKDANEKKTMNTHLHIIEPYTNLYRVWKDVGLRERLQNLLCIFMDKIYNPQTHHLGLFFSDSWQSRCNIVSFGHDIEASWLLLETALTIGDNDMQDQVMHISRNLALFAAEGLQPDGSMIYERFENGETDAERHWWVQAETVVGYLWQAHYYNDTKAYDKAFSCWKYIQTNLIDTVNGEWWWGVHSDGSKDVENDKVGFWKCPYHNTRMCLEIIKLLSPL